MFRAALKILEATIGIEASKESLLPPPSFNIEVKSLLTDFYRVDLIPYSESLNGYIRILESLGSPRYARHGKEYIFSGAFDKLSHAASDLRFSFWGNQGFLYRYILYLLEKYHDIYNLHACALFDQNDGNLYIIIGGAGSGKTVYLLSGLEKGLKLFSTETVHFRLKKNNIELFKGSLVDNIRKGTLLYDFPQFLGDSDLSPQEEIWQTKIAVDLSAHATDFETLINPSGMHIIFPHVEEGREGFVQTTIKDAKRSSKILFDNISQKIGETTILYDQLTVLGLDEIDMARSRLEKVRCFVDHSSITQILSILSNPKDCWGNLFS